MKKLILISLLMLTISSQASAFFCTVSSGLRFGAPVTIGEIPGVLYLGDDKWDLKYAKLCAEKFESCLRGTGCFASNNYYKY